MRIFVELSFLLIVGFGWGLRLFSPDGLGLSRKERWPLWVAVMGVALILALVLRNWADPAVADSSDLGWTLIFMAGGALWLWLAAGSFLILNLSLKLDALGSRNPAAIWATSSALLGAGLVYAGGNVDSGDEAASTVVSALLGYVVWFGSWALLEGISGISERIVVDRQRGPALRLSLVLIVNGIVVFRAVAGDWVSFASTLGDLARKGWPAVAFALVMALMERAIQKART